MIKSHFLPCVLMIDNVIPFRSGFTHGGHLTPFYLLTYLLHHKGTNGTLLSAGGEILDQTGDGKRFAVILYDNNREQFVFSARRWHNTVGLSSFICQLQEQGLLIIMPPYSTEIGLSTFNFYTLCATSTNVLWIRNWQRLLHRHWREVACH